MGSKSRTEGHAFGLLVRCLPTDTKHEPGPRLHELLTCSTRSRTRCLFSSVLSPTRSTDMLKNVLRADAKALAFGQLSVAFSCSAQSAAWPTGRNRHACAASVPGGLICWVQRLSLANLRWRRPKVLPWRTATSRPLLHSLCASCAPERPARSVAGRFNTSTLEPTDKHESGAREPVRRDV